MDIYEPYVLEMKEFGLRKTVLNIAFQGMEKPSEVSTVLIKIEEPRNVDGRPTEYLGSTSATEKEMIMGTALTPIDMRLERMVQEMMVGERSLIEIKTKSDDLINCIVTLKKIISSKEVYNLSAKEIYDLALQFKINGVKMYKNYLNYASEYFAKGIHLLISLRPIKNIPLSRSVDGIDKCDVKTLLNQLRLNIAACHLENNLYDHVIYVTKFIEKQHQPSEKGVYRRAKAFFHLKEYEKAKNLLAKVPKYMEKKEFALLHKQIMENWQLSNNSYKNMVKKMFR